MYAEDYIPQQVDSQSVSLDPYLDMDEEIDDENYSHHIFMAGYNSDELPSSRQWES